MSLPESEIVQVLVSVSQSTVSKNGFGLICVFGTSNALPTGQRFGLFSGLTDVGNVFPADSLEYQAAKKVFAMSPPPSQVMIARMFTAAVPAELLGSLTPVKDLASYTAIANGAISLHIDGTAENVTGIDLSGAGSLSQVATAVQTAVAALKAGSTCVYQNGRFILRSGTTGITSALTFATAAPAGTDLAPMLGFRQADGATLTQGQAVESVTQSLQNISTLNSDWYMGLLATNPTDQNIKDAAAFALASRKVFGYTTSASAAVDAASTTDIGAVLQASSNNRVMGVFDLTGTEPFAVAEAFAAAATVDFWGQDTTETLMFKTLAGTAVSPLTTSQKSVLDSKNYNYYANIGSNPMFAKGVMADGTWFDQVQGLDWLAAALQDEAMATFIGNKKLAQTDKGLAVMMNRLKKVMDQAVKNGFLAPGLWTGAPVGQIKTNQLLASGYYMWADSVDNQPQSVRNTRQSPPITILAKGAGALQGLNILLNFQQ